jgi:hypothetical protein
VNRLRFERQKYLVPFYQLKDFSFYRVSRMLSGPRSPYATDTRKCIGTIPSKNTTYCRSGDRIDIISKDWARPKFLQICYLCFFVIRVVLLLIVMFYVLFMCKCILPPGVNPIAVDKYININTNISEFHHGYMFRPFTRPSSG